jgi:hypothetical protein
MNLREEMLTSHGSWFCAGLCFNGDEVLVVEVEVTTTIIPGDELPPAQQLKFPGGSMKINESRRDTNPEDTLRAEFNEEVFSPEGGEITSWEPVCKYSSGNHSKYFSLVEITGELRQVPLREPDDTDEKGRSQKEVIGVPQFMRVDRVARAIFHSHGKALAVLCEQRRHQSANFYYALEILKERGLA